MPHTSALYIFVHLRERRWEVVVALPDTFTASRLVFFDWHLPKFDVNIDRVISCDFVPSAFPLKFCHSLRFLLIAGKLLLKQLGT